MFIREASIGTKIHVPLILAIMIGLLIILFTSYRALNKMKENTYADQVQHMTDRVRAATTAKNNVWLTNAMQLAKNHDIVDAYVARDRETLTEVFKGIGEMYRSSTPFKRVAVHLVSPDLKSVFKSWKPEKHGETLDYSRGYKEVFKTRKPLVTYEESTKGFRINGLFPMEKDGQIVGLLNFEGGINNFGGEMKREEIDFLYFVDPKYAGVVTKDLEKKEGYLLSSSANVDKEFKNYVMSAAFSMVEAVNNPYIVDEHYFTVAVPLKSFADETIGWALMAEKTEHIEEVVDQATNALITQVIIMALIDILLLVFIAMMLSRAVTRPINGLKEIIQDLVEGEGDLTKRLNYSLEVKDEISGIAVYIDEFIAHVHGVIKETKDASLENVASAEELSQTARQMRERAKNSTEVTTQARNKTGEIKQYVDQSVGEATNTRDDMSSAQQELMTAKDSTSRLAEIVSGSVQKEQDLTDRLNQLNTDVGQIKDVLGIINDIADQTNLLALNAAIEAARAGEHGRGFAVVADEVKKLAEKTQKSLTEINSTVNVIVQAIVEASSNMNDNMQEIEQLHTVTGEVEEKIDSVHAVMCKAVDSSDKSRDLSEQIRRLIDEIKDLTEAVQDNAAQDSQSVEEISATAGNLESMVNSLNQKLDQFKV